MRKVLKVNEWICGYIMVWARLNLSDKYTSQYVTKSLMMWASRAVVAADFNLTHPNNPNEKYHALWYFSFNPWDFEPNQLTVRYNPRISHINITFPHTLEFFVNFKCFLVGKKCYSLCHWILYKFPFLTITLGISNLKFGKSAGPHYISPELNCKYSVLASDQVDFCCAASCPIGG